MPLYPNLITDMVVIRFKEHAQKRHVSGSIACPYNGTKDVTRYIDDKDVNKDVHKGIPF